MERDLGETMRDGLDGAGDLVRRAADRRWVVPLARVGLIARAIVFGLIGGAALPAARLRGGDLESPQEAVARVAGMSPVLLGIVGVGLAGYALWRAIQALFDPEGRVARETRWALRAGRLVTAIAYGGLAALAFRLLAGAGGRAAAEGDPSRTAAGVLSWPLGRWLLLAAAVVVAIGAAQELVQAWRGHDEDLRYTSGMSPIERRVAEWSLRLGRGARGLAFVVIAWSLVRAGWQADAGEVRGLDGALATLATAPGGTALLAVVGAGFVAYAVYSLVLARYRRIALP